MNLDVILVSCRRQLKYNLYEMLHHKGRKAKATESFAVFAPFAVSQIMKSSPHPSLTRLPIPLPICSTSLVVWGLTGAFAVPRGCLVRINNNNKYNHSSIQSIYRKV
jgi:hypothetical protein